MMQPYTGDKRNGVMDTKEFTLATGRLPENADLERVNCNEVGSVGHYMCGVCHEHSMPRFAGHSKCKSGIDSHHDY